MRPESFRRTQGEATPRARTCLAVVILAAFPIMILHSGFRSESGFLRLLTVGRVFEPRALPELRDAAPPLESPYGYDGQFYAQLSLDPTLRRPELLEALDAPSYRARRIALPLLAHVLGLGRPAIVLQIYALLNFGFWALLLAALLHHVGLRRPRDFLLAIALLWSSGTLISLERALTDFPAAALGAIAVWRADRPISCAGLLSVACLIKETSLLQISTIGRSTREPGGARHPLIAWALVLLPVALWISYVNGALPGAGLPLRGNLALPGTGLALKLLGAAEACWNTSGGVGRLVLELFELLAPAALAVQAGYLIAHPRLASPLWRLGAGFAALALVLGPQVWCEQYAFCRVLLPLTASFNLLVHRHEEGPRYALWFVAGNLGMGWMCLDVLRRGAALVLS